MERGGARLYWTKMNRNMVLCCCCYIHVTVVTIVMYGLVAPNHFWSRNACSLSIKEAIQSMLGFTYTLNEPSQEKTNDLHMRKQTRRSAVQ